MIFNKKHNKAVKNKRNINYKRIKEEETINQITKMKLIISNNKKGIFYKMIHFWIVKFQKENWCLLYTIARKVLCKIRNSKINL